MRITPLASTFTDNWMYLVVDGDQAMLVDPIDADVAVAAARDSGAREVFVFCTHGHPDHVGGNASVKAALGCPVVGSSHSTRFAQPYDRFLSHGDTLSVGDTTFDIIHAPGHVDGHIVAHTPGHLISGDVYFVGGAGHCKLGGEPGELHRTFTERLAAIPDDTVFYPGHDYAQRNLAFCLDVEPHNAGAAERQARWSAHTRADGPVLTTLGEERAYNPFHRTKDPVLQSHLFGRYPNREAKVADPSERAFRIVRGLRDTY